MNIAHHLQKKPYESQSQAVYEGLADLFPEEVKKSDDANLSSLLFKEIIGRSIADVSGHLNLPPQGSANNPALDQRITIGRVFKGIKSALETLGVPHDSLLDFFLGNISGFTKTIVQTPHPTEMLGREAIEAEEKLLNALEVHGKELFKNTGIKLHPNDLSAIRDTMAALYEALQSPSNKMTVAEEMRRSVVFSQRMFDAVPMIADRILTESKTNSHQLSDEQLRHLGHLVNPMTWSPGDQDSKPLMTVEELKNGYALNHRAMLKHYAIKLKKIYDSVSDNAQVNQGDKDALIGMIRDLLGTAQNYEENREKQGQQFDKYVEEALYLEDEQPGSNTQSVEKTARDIVNHASQPKFYTKADELIEDLGKLRDSNLNHNMKLNGGQTSTIGAIDALIIQAHNFGLSALKVQIRQNQDVHNEVFKHVVSLLPDDMGHIQSPAQLLEALRNPQVKRKVSAVIKAELEKIKKAGTTEPLKYMGKDEGKEKTAYVYQVLKSMEFAAEHPDFIPHYLIAECGGPDEAGHARGPAEGCNDMLNALALLTIMQPDDAKKLVEIVPLVEHPNQVMEDADGNIPYVEMMKSAFENDDFRGHQGKVSGSNYQHLLTHITVEERKVVSKPLTGTDVLASINPEFGKESCGLSSSDQPIGMAKLCMGAGSDVTKFGGVAAAAMMQNAMVRLKEELASLDKPVYVIDYLGCGGGVHRTQPVSNAAETVQGRSMRQTPDAIATKTTALLARFIRDRLGSQPGQTNDAQKDISRLITSQDRNILAQLNMGNLANLPRNPTSWNVFTKGFAQQASKNYQDFIQSEPYKQMLAYTADIFCKMTSYAARPVNRLGAASDGAKQFPPPVEMGKLRAIGYGGSLNVSGSCAALYMGLSNITEVATSDLVSHYKFDPLLQDTINRATYGIVMSDMDIAWQYVGRPSTPSQAELEQFVASAPAADAHIEQAEKALAKITLERQKIGKKLVELHSRVQGKPPKSGLDWQEQLLNALPSEYVHQLRASKENLHAPRQALADLFKRQLSGEAVIPDKDDPSFSEHDTYKNVIYPAMATIFESFEHAPRALTSPNWGLKSSPQALCA